MNRRFQPQINKRVITNEQIRAQEVRLIDKDGKQLGIFKLEEALNKARETGLDLILITQNVQPPVCKIMELDKYLYHLQKKERKIRPKKTGELKIIRLTFNISPHDLETRAKTAETFLEKGYKVRVEMILRGREKWMSDFTREKINLFLEILKKLIPIKIERELKREMRGLSMIVARS